MHRMLGEDNRHDRRSNKDWAVLGIEPRTSRTLSENHATRPNSQYPEFTWQHRLPTNHDPPWPLPSGLRTSMAQLAMHYTPCVPKDRLGCQTMRVACSCVCPKTYCQRNRRLSPSKSSQKERGLFWELNPGPLAPEARIMPLDQTADH